MNNCFLTHFLPIFFLNSILFSVLQKLSQGDQKKSKLEKFVFCCEAFSILNVFGGRGSNSILYQLFQIARSTKIRRKFVMKRVKRLGALIVTIGGCAIQVQSMIIIGNLYFFISK